MYTPKRNALKLVFRAFLRSEPDSLCPCGMSLKVLAWPV